MYVTFKGIKQKDRTLGNPHLNQGVCIRTCIRPGVRPVHGHREGELLGPEPFRRRGPGPSPTRIRGREGGGAGGPRERTAGKSRNQNLKHLSAVPRHALFAPAPWAPRGSGAAVTHFGFPLALLPFAPGHLAPRAGAAPGTPLGSRAPPRSPAAGRRLFPCPHRGVPAREQKRRSRMRSSLSSPPTRAPPRRGTPLDAPAVRAPDVLWRSANGKRVRDIQELFVPRAGR